MQGSPSTSASVLLTCALPTPCAVNTLEATACTFAGGFAPVRVVSLAGFAAPESKDIAWVELHTAYPADGNQAQTFAWDGEQRDAAMRAQGYAPDTACTHLGVRMHGSTDGFGRVIAYRLSMQGT